MKIKKTDFFKDFEMSVDNFNVFIDDKKIDRVFAIDYNEETGYGSAFIMERYGFYDDGIAKKLTNVYIEKFGKMRLEKIDPSGKITT